MQWETEDVIESGSVKVFSRGSAEFVDGQYEMSMVKTGRTKTFYGYRLTIRTPNACYRGMDRHGLRACVEDCNEKLQLDGLEIRVAAVSKQFSESGLSSNSGWGYQREGSRRVRLMDPEDTGIQGPASSPSPPVK